MPADEYFVVTVEFKSSLGRLEFLVPVHQHIREFTLDEGALLVLHREFVVVKLIGEF